MTENEHITSPIEDKGSEGEQKVSSILVDLPDDYYVFNGVLLRNWKGDTTQIDHIVVSKYGIFVIETKNYCGKVYGSEKHEQWSVYYRGNAKDYKLYNPVMQNEAHKKMLKGILSKYGDVHCYSVIAFSDAAVLKVSVESAVVTNFRYLKDVITEHDVVLLSEKQVAAIIDTIENVRLDGNKEVAESHISKAIEKKESSIERIQEGKCPRCGGDLVLRYGKFGDFIACENYPRCYYKPNA